MIVVVLMSGDSNDILPSSSLGSLTSMIWNDDLLSLNIDPNFLTSKSNTFIPCDDIILNDDDDDDDCDGKDDVSDNEDCDNNDVDNPKVFIPNDFDTVNNDIINNDNKNKLYIMLSNNKQCYLTPH